MRNEKIAVAIALAIGGVSAAHAAGPAVSACATPGASLYVAGSSAAQPAFAAALANDLFGGTANLTTISGTNGNFKAYCGAATGKGATGATIAPGTIVTVYYRGEGGSVVGALPIVNSKAVKQLALGATSCQTTAPTVNGTSATVGTTDGWTGCVTTHQVEMGVTDLEPAVFVPPNYPTAYSTGVFGSATGSQLSQLPQTPLFQQVFGIYVNTSGLNLGGAPLNLSRETVGQILTGAYANWNAVPSASGGAVSSTSQPIKIVNREAGSGTRTGASLYFLGTECNPSAIPLQDGPASLDAYATGDALTTAASIPGAITYASIDNVKAGLTLAQLSGVTPTNLAAATGQYDWWFEATAQRGNITSTGGTNLYTWLTSGELTNVATAPHTAQVLAIPNAGTNSATVPLTSDATGGTTIYINPFTRGGASCNFPGETN